MSRFLKHFFIYGLGSIIGKIAAIFLLPLYTNVLTQKEYGALAIIIAAKGILDIFVNLNIHSGVAREYYECNNRNKLVSTGFWSILLFSFSTIGLIFFTKGFWIDTVLDISGYERAFALMLLTLPLGSLFSFFGILTRFGQQPLQYSIGSILQIVIQIIFTILFVLVFRRGIEGVLYGMIIGHSFGFIFYFLVIRANIKITFDRYQLKKILNYSLPTLPAILAAWIDSSLGQVLIGNYVSLESAGVYSIALRLASVYLFFHTAFRNVWEPYVFENYKKDNFKNDLYKLFKYTSFVLVLISLHLALLSKELILLFSNNSYLKASEYLVLLTFPFSLTILMQFVEIGPKISRKTKYISYATISGSTLNLILLFSLLPTLGVIIVPISLSISKLIAYIMMSRITYRELKYSFPYFPIILIVIITLIGHFFIVNIKLPTYVSVLFLLTADIGLLIYYFPSIKNRLKLKHETKTVNHK